MFRYAGSSAFIALLCLASGCVSVAIGGAHAITHDAPVPPPAYSLARVMPVIKFDARKNFGSYTVQKFFFASQIHSGYAKNDLIRGAVYLPKHLTVSDVFIILPGSHEDTSADMIAGIFVTMGYVAVRIRSGFSPIPQAIRKAASLEHVPQKAVDLAGGFCVEAMEAHVIDLMRLEDYLATWDGIPHPRAFHAVGVSLGGISAELLAGVDPRVHSLFTINSAGSIARILMDTRNPEISQLREILMEKFGLNREKSYRLIAQRLRLVEPLTYAARIDTSRILMVSAGFDMLGIPVDSAIPLSATKETWNAYGRPEWITMLFMGHASAFGAFVPGWIEFPYVWHLPFTLTGSYAAHLIRFHYLPKALRD